MSDNKRCFVFLTLLILIGLLPVNVASAQDVSLQQVDQEKIDAYIHSRMQAANIPGLALGVVYDDQVIP